MSKLTSKSKNRVSRINADTFILPKFAKQIHQLISSKYKNTFVVGGAVRNYYLHKKVIDVDIATIATPAQIVKMLLQNEINYSVLHAKLGIIVASKGKQRVEIATFRSEQYSQSRFPIVRFIKSVERDSQRRDFTINALYFSPETSQVLDFHKGINDIKKGLVRFIGEPLKRIQEDPLRIVRAHRFALQYNLQLEDKTAQAVKNNLHLLKKISKVRLQKEINTLKPKILQKQLQKVIHSTS